MADLLELLTEADRLWARRRRAAPASPEYLVHLASALGDDSLDCTAELERLTVERDAFRDRVRALVCAVTGRWGRLRDVDRQVTEALRQVDVVRAHLEWLYGPDQSARAG